MESKDVAVKFNNPINNGDLDGLAELMKEEHRFIDSNDRVFKGKKKL